MQTMAAVTELYGQHRVPGLGLKLRPVVQVCLALFAAVFYSEKKELHKLEISELFKEIY